MKKKAKRRETFKTMLPKIVRFINTNPEGQKLWNVLTALRGPDIEDLQSRWKDSTTAVIRRAIGLDGGIARHPSSFTVLPDTKASAKFRESIYKNNNPDFPFHFTSHAQNAFRALELDWKKSNEDDD